MAQLLFSFCFILSVLGEKNLGPAEGSPIPHFLPKLRFIRLWVCDGGDCVVLFINPILLSTFYVMSHPNTVPYYGHSEMRTVTGIVGGAGAILWSPIESTMFSRVREVEKKLVACLKIPLRHRKITKFLSLRISSLYDPGASMPMQLMLQPHFTPS
ncbi:hypothetical protein HOY80DRAFT_75729 [Tuber brumale]|nr:hypothetical protein HOY80DRAFT_75729 [Tuber brumale]